MSVHLPREEVSTVLKLAREVALQLDADSNRDEDYVEVHLLRAVEALEQRMLAQDSADVGSCSALSEEGEP